MSGIQKGTLLVTLCFPSFTVNSDADSLVHKNYREREDGWRKKETWEWKNAKEKAENGKAGHLQTNEKRRV